MRLAQLRKKHKMSQQALANKLNISRSAIAMWETGRCDPDIDTIKKIANIFNVSVGFLLEETNIPGTAPSHDKSIRAMDMFVELSPEAQKKVEEYIELLKLKESQNKQP